jgi:hypothetical protein
MIEISGKQIDVGKTSQSTDDGEHLGVERPFGGNHLMLPGQ